MYDTDRWNTVNEYPNEYGDAINAIVCMASHTVEISAREAELEEANGETDDS